MAVLALLAWMVLLVRLAWAVVKRTLVARRLEDGRLAIRPEYPSAGGALHVRFEQEVRTEVDVRAVDLTLVGERTTYRLRGGKARGQRTRVAGERLRLAAGATCRPGVPLHVEGTWQVPAGATEEEGFLAWRVEVRTRVFGPDYVTLFPIGAPEDEEKAGEG